MTHTSSSPVALVTGASAGIGAATVRALLDQRFVVYGAARRIDRMQQLSEDGARIVELDVTEEASLVAAIERVRGECGRLDVLVNNAGYGSFGALEDVPPHEARRQFDVNVFGAARLTQLALPMMRAQKSGTVVNVSSMGGKIYEPYGAWYHATKFALEGLSDCLRLELAQFGIRVVVIEPGNIKTEWGAIAVDSLLERSGSTAYATAATQWAALMRNNIAGGSDPSVIADTIVHAVRARRPRARYAAGAFAVPMLTLRRFLPDRVFDAIMLSLDRTARVSTSTSLASEA